MRRHSGGEDHALLATFPRDAQLPDGFRAIGRVVERSGSPLLVDGGRTPARAAGTPTATGTRTAADRHSATRTHHSVVSPYRLSRAWTSPAGSVGRGERAAALDDDGRRVGKRRHEERERIRQLALAEVVRRVDEDQVVGPARTAEEGRDRVRCTRIAASRPTDFATLAALR